MAPLHKDAREQSSLLSKTKSLSRQKGFLFYVFVLGAGLEPATPSSSGKCSTN